MKNKKGISLIVLIITVVVIIILATAIIVNIAQSNIIGNANQAVVKQDFKTMQEELNMYYADKYADTLGKFNSATFNADETTTPSIYDVLTTLKGSKYDGYVTIVNGSIVLSEDIDEKIKKWAMEAIGVIIKDTEGDTTEDATENIVSINDILTNPSEYYGKEVEYVVESENLVASSSTDIITLAEQYDDTTWKVFYADEEHVYLIASDTLRVSGEQYNKVFANATEALNYIGTQSNWSSFVNNYADYAIGGPTITMFANSWNEKYPNNIITLTGDETNGWKINGKSDLELVVNDELYCNENEWYLLNSKAIDSTFYPMQINGKIIASYGPEAYALEGEENQYYSEIGFRPVVCLKQGMVFLTSSSNDKLYIAINEVNRTLNGEEPSYKNPIIPAGFTSIETETASWNDTDDDDSPDGWNNGLVIADSIGNEFVWVPVEGQKYVYGNEYHAETSNGTISGGKVYSSNTSFPNGVSNDENQITKYGGFYIARYEAGVPDKTSSPQNTTGLPLSQKDCVAWTNIKFSNAKANAESMYNTDKVKSGLLTPKAWVTLVNWFLSCDIEVLNDEKVACYGNFCDSVSPANIEGYGKKQNTGFSDYWKINNIYDIVGNVSEYSNYYFNYLGDEDKNSIVINGGWYDANASSLNGQTGTHIDDDILYNQYKETMGFRVMLYID